MLEREAILFANDAFYEAFRARDFEAMAAIWADSAPVACIHPGWEALHGREAVLRSWRAILSGDGAPPGPRCRAARVLPLGEDAAAVLCYEEIGRSLLAATNLFVREAGAWRLAHHQAGPTRLAPANLEEEAPPALQ